jgi:transcriptional regulator of arginine metabolism
MKSKRHEKIIELINQYEVETQEELAALLTQAGFRVTQATISRDIRELRLSKVNSHDGKQKYVAMAVRDNGMSDRLGRVLKEGYLSSMEASHMVVVRTVPGMAMAVAAALDAMDLPGFAGCIAGDDTIMCALHSDADVEALFNRINKVVNQ